MELVEHIKELSNTQAFEGRAGCKYKIPPVKQMAFNWSTKALPSIYISIITHCNKSLVIVH